MIKMRKGRMLMLAVLLGAMALTACNDDNTPPNQFTFDGETYSFTHGFMYNDTIVDDSIYVNSIVLLSEDLKVHWTDDHSDIDSITGRGEALTMIMFSTEYDGPASGTYLHDSLDIFRKGGLSELPKLFVWVYGDLLINYAPEGKEIGNKYRLTGGTMKVNKKGGNRFEFTFDLQTEDGKEAKGFSSVILETFMEQMSEGTGASKFIPFVVK